MPKFPSRIFVTLDPDDSKPSPDLLAYRTFDAVQDDGPTEVAVYTLGHVQRLRKQTVVDVPKKK